MNKTADVKQDFFENDLFVLSMIEHVQFIEKSIKELESTEDEGNKDLACDLKENISNLKRLYSVYNSFAVANAIIGDKKQSVLVDHLESLFEDIK